MTTNRTPADVWREMLRGNVISADGKSALLLVFLAEGTKTQPLAEKARALAIAELGPVANVYFGGAPFAGQAIYDDTQHDVRRLTPLAMLLFFVIVLLAFRGWLPVVLTVATVGLAGVLVLGGMGLWGEAFTVVTGTLPLILFASGSQYAIHILGRYYLVRDAQHSAGGGTRIAAAVEALRIAGPPVTVAAVNCCLGFLSFSVMNIHAMRTFGFACSFGVLFCLLFALTVLPAVVARWEPAAAAHGERQHFAGLGNRLLGVFEFSRRHRVLVVAGTVLLAVLCGGGMTRVEVRMNPSAFFRPGSEPELAEKFMDRSFGGAHFAQVLIEGDIIDPRALSEVRRLTTYARSLPNVTQVQSIVDPISLVGEAMAGLRGLPALRGQVSTLLFFMEGEPSLRTLMTPDRKAALLHIRVQGDAAPILTKVEEYLNGRWPFKLHRPTPEDLAEELCWLLPAGERAGRQAALLCDAADRQRRQAGFLGGLEHAGIAHRQRRADAAADDLHRVVPGHDVAGDAVRLAQRQRGVAVGERDGLAMHLVGRATVELQVTGHRHRIGAALLDRLADIQRLQAGQLVGAGQRQGAHLQQDAAALGGGQLAPGAGERVVGGGHRGIHVGGGAAGDLRQQAAVAGVQQRQGLAAGAGAPVAVDQDLGGVEADGGHVRSWKGARLSAARRCRHTGIAMHQPSTTPRPSLYYRYQVHAPWLPSAHPPQPRHPVVIAGAGPAGLVTALELARHGVPSVVLNAELQVSAGSRAIVFTRRTLEILQQVGVAGRLMADGLPWRCGNSFYRGQRVFRMEAPHDDDDRFGPMLNIQQQFLEEHLLDACAATGLVDLRWGNRLEQVDQRGDHALLTIDTPAGPYTLQADWLVAADGGRSGIRSQLGLQMEGASFESLFVIADIRIDLPYPTERLAFFDPDWNRGNTILMHREPHGIWRVDYQLPPGETPEQALQPESMRTRIDAQLAMVGHAGVPWELDWSSVYSARAMTLPDYVHGRIAFAGDAAHLHLRPAGRDVGIEAAAAGGNQFGGANVSAVQGARPTGDHCSRHHIAINGTTADGWQGCTCQTDAGVAVVDLRKRP